MTFESLWALAVPLLQIVWIDILLSGDNAVVIALACKNLPERQRKLGVLLGASAAVALRIAFMVVVVELLTVPYLKIAAGFVLLLIAVKLINDSEGEHEVKARTTLLGAVMTIAVADAAMSLDNVIAIAAAARDHMGLMIFGVLLSIPLVMFGSGFIIKLMQRWPIVVWAGAALLGWVAGEMIASDPRGDPVIGPIPDFVVGLFCAGLVVAVGYALSLRRRRAVDRQFL